MPSLGLGLNLYKTQTAVYSGLKLDAQAVAHYDRVIADGGIMPAGLLGCNAWFVAVKAVYGVTDITTAISAGYDPHYLGAKIGAGSGTTLGQAATKLYSCSGASGDLVQETAASMPLLLVKNSTDANYWFGSGVSGNYCSTPNAAANQITGDIEFIASVTPYELASINQTICCKGYTGSLRGYRLALNDRYPTLILSTTGSDILTYNSTAQIPNSPNTTIYIKVERVQSTGIIKFYSSLDGVTYTQLGSNVAGTTSALYSPAFPVFIGEIDGVLPFKGRINRLTISNSIGGTPVVDFNPASYNAATSQSSWVSATSETWTINTGTATTGYKGVLVSKTITMYDGVDDTLGGTQTDTFRTTFAAIRVNRTGVFFAGVLNNNLASANANSQWFYTVETTNQIDASATLSDTQYVNNSLTATYTPYRLFLGQIDLGATPNTANGRLIGYLGANNYLCGVVNSLLQPIVNPTSTQRTATYNVLRTFEDNAF